MKNRAVLTALTLGGALAGCSQAGELAKPNIVYILADDLGYGDISLLGQDKFATPNIDRLISEGMFFTQHYAGSSVSAPSRSTLLTGLHTGNTPIRGNKPYEDEGQEPLPADSYNVMKMLKESGYATGVYGKWGLGAPSTEGDPNRQGVDEFFGYNCQRLAHHYYPYHLWDNQTKVTLEGNKGQSEDDYAPYLIHNRAKDFITKNKKKPFFLYYASILPHAELLLPREEMEQFAGEFLPEKRYRGVDSGKNYRQGPYGSQAEPRAAFAAMVTLLDKQVGDIVAHLDSLGLAENTLIIFSTDNGAHREGGADPDYFNSTGGFRGYKRDLYEGGIRVPMVARWRGRIEPNTTTNHISAFWDFMPTVADILDVEVKSEMDGVSFLPTLLGESTQQEHEYLYWEFHEQGGRQAVRYGDWKGVKYNVSKGGKLELYNLQDDVTESVNRAASEPKLVAEIEAIMKGARTESNVFKFASDTFNGDVN